MVSKGILPCDIQYLLRRLRVGVLDALVQRCATPDVRDELERYVLPVIATVALVHHATAVDNSTNKFLEMVQIALDENVDEGEAVGEDDAEQLG